MDRTRKSQAQIRREIDDIVEGSPRTSPTSSAAAARRPIRRDRKSEIESSAIGGLRLSGRDVASLSRDQRAMRLRHVWPESTDARVWDGVRRAFMAWAREVADRSGKSVEVYSRDGFVLEQVGPER